MNKTVIIFLFVFLISHIELNSQTIEQLGYYSVNGIESLDSKPNMMVLGNGDIVDISNPLMPELSGNYSLLGFSLSVLVSEDYAYFGIGMVAELYIVDISNPSLPLETSTLNFPEAHGIYSIAKNNDILYLVVAHEGIYSVDISDKTNPVVIDTLFNVAEDIVTKSDFAYAASMNGLKIIDISDSSNMLFVTSIGSGYNCIDINDSLVFLGKEDGIDVYNISNPSNPSFEFEISHNAGASYDVKYNANYLYVTTNDSALIMYKIEDNQGIREANFYPNYMHGQCWEVSLQDSLILLPGLYGGIAILQYDSTGTVSTETIESKNRIYVSPNPAKNSICIKNLATTIEKIEFIDTKGKVIKSIDNVVPGEVIDISNLPSGHCIIRVKTNEKVIIKKMIKIE